MATYGSQAAVLALLKGASTVTLPAEAGDRIDALLAVASALVEARTGRTFGTGTTAETVVVPAPGVTDVLVLPKGVRTVTSVTVGASWDGAGWVGGITLPAALWVPVWRQSTGEWLALARADGAHWAGPVVIAGTWEDTDADATVPDEITYVVNYLAAEGYKREQASANGVIGPDGAAVPIRDAWKDPWVKGVLDTWTVSAAVVV